MRFIYFKIVIFLINLDFITHFMVLKRIWPSVNYFNAFEY